MGILFVVRNLEQAFFAAILKFFGNEPCFCKNGAYKGQEVCC